MKILITVLIVVAFSAALVIGAIQAHRKITIELTKKRNRCNSNF